MTRTVIRGEAPDAGQYNIPATAKEIVFQLSMGVPIQIPKNFALTVVVLLDEFFDNGRFEIETRDRLAFITPQKHELSEHGRNFLEEGK